MNKPSNDLECSNHNVIDDWTLLIDFLLIALLCRKIELAENVFAFLTLKHKNSDKNGLVKHTPSLHSTLASVNRKLC